MIFFEPFLVVAALASITSVAATELAPPEVDCYTIWADGYRAHVPTYYESVVHRGTSRLIYTLTPVETVTTVGATTTQTSTITTTILAGDATSTVAASPGFTPLASVIAANQAIYPGHVERPRVTALPKQSGINSLSSLMRCLYYYDCYPAEVNCIVHIRDVYTATEVYQATETVTSTVIAIGVTATATFTQTDTVTASAAAIATVYQVCQADNVIASYSATQPWTDAQFNGNLGLSTGTDGTDCCNKCAEMGDTCQSSAYTDAFAGANCAYFLAGDATLHALNAATCNGSFVAGIAIYSTAALIASDEVSASSYVFSNSNCGQLAVQAAGTT
ncbi:hypothetical protein VPNG_09949 [Cytospora leucostoma]|uniref:Apple domain-containing protein n=1 Tax=Cytospora leucostoma TaxID=1230097 RepID=A0A423VLF6_9PEZI|nr:hypothetical protein VPNG_09949 [Cytospora leucostoma]